MSCIFVLTTGNVGAGPRRHQLPGGKFLYLIAENDRHEPLLGLIIEQTIPEIPEWPVAWQTFLRSRVNRPGSRYPSTPKQSAALHNILKAAMNGHLTVTTMPSRIGAPVTVLAAVVQKPSGGQVVPLARLWDGDPYNELRK